MTMSIAIKKTTKQQCLSIVLGFVLGFCTLPVYSKGVYQTIDEFVADVFVDAVPQKKVLWLKGENKNQLKAIFGRESVGVRQRYWVNGDKTAWVFNEIGKELPITIGVVIKDDQILSIKVLEYRESRGAEVRHDFFTDQFKGVRLDKRQQLSQSIDGISGATLSVWSMQRVARAALFLHQGLFS